MCVELGSTVRIGAFYLNLTQIMIPFSFRLTLNLRKIPSGILRLQILTCILYRNIRYPNLILDIFFLLTSKVK